MAKKTKEDFEQDFFKDLAKNMGGDLLDNMDSNNFGYIDTGVLACNYICSGKFIGGGIPCGTLAEISGMSAAGKTLIGTNILKGCQNRNGIAVLHDVEYAVSKDFAIKASKINAKTLVVTESDTLPGSFNKIHNIIRYVREERKIPLNIPLVIVYDSIAASPSEREINQNQFDLENTSIDKLKSAGAGVEKPGERAKICSTELRKLMPIVKKNNVLIVFINQLRTNIMASYGADPMSESGGGLAMKYYCSTRMRMYSSKKIRDDKKQIIGTNVRLANTKSRFTDPFQEVSGIRLLFKSGIDSIGGLLDLMLRLGRISAGEKKSNYVVNEPYANGKEVLFKAKIEDGIIPWEVLIECPLLVDAENSEQVQYYYDTFGEANKVAMAEGNTEEEFARGDEIC